MYIETKDEQLPTTIDSLIDWLEEAYPNKMATRELSGFEQGVLVGQQEVINKIIEIQKQKDL